MQRRRTHLLIIPVAVLALGLPIFVWAQVNDDDEPNLSAADLALIDEAQSELDRLADLPLEARAPFYFRWALERDETLVFEPKDRTSYDPQYNKQPLATYEPMYELSDDPALQVRHVHASKGDAGDRVVVTWQPVPRGSLYMVQRRVTADIDDAMLVAITPNPYYVDFDATDGTCFRYNVRTISMDMLEGPPSPTACGFRLVHETDAEPMPQPINEYEPILAPRDESEVEAARIFELDLDPLVMGAPLGCECGAEEPLQTVPELALGLPEYATVRVDSLSEVATPLEPMMP